MITAIVAPHGQTTILELDAQGYLHRLTDPAQATTVFTFDSGGLLTTLTDARKQTHVFTYDASGRLQSDQDAAGSTKTLVRTRDASGEHVTVTTTLGKTSTYTIAKYATGDEARTSELSTGLVAREQRASDGTRTTVLPNGTKVVITRSPDPRFGLQAPLVTREVITTPSGLVRTRLFSRSAPLANSADPFSFTQLVDTVVLNGRSYTSTFDKISGLLTTTTPLGRTSTTSFDVKGRIVEEQVAGLEPVAYAYDAEGRLVSTTQNTRTWTRQYDAAGWLAGVTDAAQKVTSYDRDAVGRVVSETRADGQSVTMVYDANGNTLSLTPPGQPAHTFTWTPRDALATYTPPKLAGSGGGATSFLYDADGQLAQTTRPDQSTIGLSRDGAGRLVATVLPAGQGTIGYSYDAKSGQLASVSGPMGVSIDYEWDGALLTKRTWSGALSGSVQHSYDNDFRVAKEMVNGGHAISFGYDADGLLVQTGELALTRDAQRGLVTGSKVGSVSESRTYDGYGALASEEVQALGANLLAVTYARDALGRIVTRTETIQGETHAYAYSYDAAGRLAEVHRDAVLEAAYSYDANGNRLGRSTAQGVELGSYDAQDRLQSYAGKVYTPTENGEPASVIETNMGTVTRYAYDALGHLRQVELPGGEVIGYVIDGENHRVWKTKNGVVVQGFLYGGALRPIAELDASGNVVARFVYGTRPNVPELVIKKGVVYRVVTDPRGSPRLVVNSVTGAIAQRLEYDEFGRVLVDTQPGFQPFGFAGGLYDIDTKLVRFGARDYDAETGRFTAKDPLRFQGGDPNLYGYGLGDPVNRLDPMGTVAVPWGALAEAAEIAGLISAAPVLLATGGLCLLALSLASDAGHDPLEEECMQYTVRCLNNPWQPDWNRKRFGPRKDCGDCLEFCRKEGYWPEDKCPER